MTYKTVTSGKISLISPWVTSNKKKKKIEISVYFWVRGLFVKFWFLSCMYITCMDVIFVHMYFLVWVTVQKVLRNISK